MRFTLNRAIAPHILRFYDTCFKQGVLDACEFGDDIGAKDFLDSRSEDWQFGILGQPEWFDWQMYRFSLYWWARKAGMKSLAENYIFKIRKIDSVWCFLPYCMRFYLLGIEEWLKYPNQTGIEVFKGTPRVHWDPKVPVKKFTNGDYISYMHDFAYAYRLLPEESRKVSQRTMDSYCLALYDLTRKI